MVHHIVKRVVDLRPRLVEENAVSVPLSCVLRTQDRGIRQVCQVCRCLACLIFDAHQLPKCPIVAAKIADGDDSRFAGLQQSTSAKECVRH